MCWLEHARRAAEEPPTCEQVQELRSSSSSCALVVLTAKPGPTNADEPEMFVRAPRRLLRDVPKLSEKKPALVQEAFHFQLFQLSQAFRGLCVSKSAAVKHPARPAFVWDALRAANRLGLTGKAGLLNNTLGDYFRYGLNPTGRVESEASQCAMTGCRPSLR